MIPQYVLITPLKNEEATIKQVIESVKNQSARPHVWIIVNDNSTDRSALILAQEVANDRWIYILNRCINKQYSWLGYGNVINAGMEFLNQLLAAGKLDSCDYVGLLDSDITTEKRYFEYLIDYLSSHPDVGVVSGDVLIQAGRDPESPWTVEYDNEHPRGGARLYNYKILREIGGFPRTPSPDKTSDIKIMSRGYQARKISTAQSFQHRETFSKENQLKGFFISGRGRYMLCYNFFHILCISIGSAITKKPFMRAGFMFFYGYISGFMTNDKRIKDDDIIKYSRDFLKRSVKRLF
jgi:glycosyltransferase involved in cell wall biosynthesis